MAQLVNLNIHGDCNITCDEKGCRSMQPCHFDTVNWNTATKTLDILSEQKVHIVNGNYSVTRNGNTVSINGNSVTTSGDLVVSTNGTSVTINGNIVSTNGNSISIYDNVKNVFINKIREDKYEGKDDKKSFDHKWQDFNVSEPKLNEIKHYGSGSLELKLPLFARCYMGLFGSGAIRTNCRDTGRCEVDSVNVVIIGSGEVSSNCSVQNLNAQVSGPGCIRGFGVTNKAKVSVTGSGTVNCNGSSVKEMKADVTGSGSISGFHVLNDIDAKIVGSGSVNLKTRSNCKRKTTVVGSGSINLSE
jgi:hypothetical protein